MALKSGRHKKRKVREFNRNDEENFKMPSWRRVVICEGREHTNRHTGGEKQILLFPGSREEVVS